MGVNGEIGVGNDWNDAMIWLGILQPDFWVR